MTEYIVTCDEETAAWIGNDVDSMRPLVRCRDCKLWDSGRCEWNPYYGSSSDDEPDGFCSWAIRRDA